MVAMSARACITCARLVDPRSVLPGRMAHDGADDLLVAASGRRARRGSRPASRAGAKTRPALAAHRQVGVDDGIAGDEAVQARPLVVLQLEQVEHLALLVGGRHEAQLAPVVGQHQADGARLADDRRHARRGWRKTTRSKSSTRVSATSTKRSDRRSVEIMRCVLTSSRAQQRIIRRGSSRPASEGPARRYRRAASSQVGSVANAWARIRASASDEVGPEVDHHHALGLVDLGAETERGRDVRAAPSSVPGPAVEERLVAASAKIRPAGSGWSRIRTSST